jgi:hypothetical protein
MGVAVGATVAPNPKGGVGNRQSGPAVGRSVSPERGSEVRVARRLIFEWVEAGIYRPGKVVQLSVEPAAKLVSLQNDRFAEISAGDDKWAFPTVNSDKLRTTAAGRQVGDHPGIRSAVDWSFDKNAEVNRATSPRRAFAHHRSVPFTRSPRIGSSRSIPRRSVCRQELARPKQCWLPDSAFRRNIYWSSSLPTR